MKYHYARGMHNRPICFGLFEGTKLIGVCAFCVPCSERVRATIFGNVFKEHVFELHRLALIDEAPKNTESYFIVRALRELKKESPNLWAIIAFSDTTQKHFGTIYQATNALYYGISESRTFYKDMDGNLRHPRQNGYNIPLFEALLKGWTEVHSQGKHRYLFLLPDSKTHLKHLNYLLKVKRLPYPKRILC